MRKYFVVLAMVCALAAWPLVAQMAEPIDYDAIVKIKQEGLGVRSQQNPSGSQVMEIMSYLTDVHGPRLTGSPNIKSAGEWARGKLTEWGLVNAKLEPWGNFGRGWQNERFSAHVISPTPYPLIGYPRAWTPGTEGPVTGEAVLVIIERPEDFDKFKGKLKGKFVFTSPVREVRASVEPLTSRFTDAQLDEMAQQPVAVTRRPGAQQQQFAGQQQLNRRRQEFFTAEGIAAWVEPGAGDGGTVFLGGGGSRDPKQNPGPPRVALAVEHYNRILRTLEKNIPVTLEMNIQNKWFDDDMNAFNVVAEIPGTDKADELVMLGAHFDSWHAGTGATDNAAGSAVMMEAVRILKATGLKMRRTVRIALWSGEEQGLLGSRAYVRQTFADAEGEGASRKWAVKPAHAKFSGYFNVDNGTGKIRGVYLQGNEAIRPLFEQWMKPFTSLGMTHLTPRNTGGTDHLAFDAVGLPGFQFIQDEVEYDTRTHHSNMDVYDRIQEADMKQMATIVASFVYLAANRAEKLPRKPMPPPPAPRPQFGQ